MERFSGRAADAYIFDMDGTIFDTERIFYDVWALAEEEFGFRGRDELFVRFAGFKVESVLDILVDYFGDADLATRVNDFRARTVERLKDTYGVRLKPGARDLLEYLWDAGIPTALATSSLPDKMARQFAAVDMVPRFGAVVTGDMVERSKPAPDIFLRAAELLGAPIETCVVVEDSMIGLAAGAASGACTILVPDILQPNPEQRAMAAEVLPSLEELHRRIRDTRSPAAVRP